MTFTQEKQFVCSSPRQSGFHKNIRRRGVSLVEVLVVLVIVVVGILAIVRLFPAGFLAVQHAGESDIASRLGEGAIENLKKNGASLPEGIYVSYTDMTPGPTFGYNLFDPNIAPDNLGSYTLPDGTVIPETDAYHTGLNTARYISNETLTVPAQHIVNGQLFPPIYPVAFGPIYLPPTIDPTVPANQAQFATYLSVISVPWTQKVGDSRATSTVSGAPLVDDPADELTVGQPQYLVDFAAGKIAVPPASYPQTFTFQIQNSAGSYQLTLTIPKTDGVSPANPNTSSNYNGGWFSPGDSTLNYLTSSNPTGFTDSQFTVASAVLTRTFKCTNYANGAGNDPYSGTSYTPARLGLNQPVSGIPDNDPYEYALCNPNIANATGGLTYANVGVIAFSPLASGQNGNPPLKARISYTVFDWHIIREDRDVPSGGSGTMRLTLDHLKKVGAVQFDNSVFSGLIPDSQHDLLLLDEETGRLDTTTVSNDIDNNAFNANQADISYQGGRVTLPTAFAGKHIRLMYAGVADWAVAVQKAPSLYTQAPVQSPPVNAVAQYAFGVIPSSNLPCLYFPKCDAGKTVELDGITYTDNNSNVQRVGTAAYAISDAADTNGNCYIILSSDAEGNGLNLARYVSNTQTTIHVVRGISARAVVIWRQNTTHWRTRSVDTLLTQTQ